MLVSFKRLETESILSKPSEIKRKAKECWQETLEKKTKNDGVGIKKGTECPLCDYVILIR